MKQKSLVNEHQIDLLKKYFPVDTERKIVTIKVSYEKATDLLDFSIGDMHCEMFSNEVLEKITEVTDKIPSDYKADVILIIDDYCGYDPNVLIEKLNDSFEINNYQIVREKKKNSIGAALLILTGFILLFILGVAKNKNWFGDEGIRKDVLEEMLDITSWVFIWQAVTIAFLTPSDLTRVSTKMFTKIESFSLADKEGKIIVSESRLDILESLEIESRIKKYRSNILLISSTFLLCLGIYRIISVFLSIADSISEIQGLVSADELATAIVMIVIVELLSLLVACFILIAGICGVLSYKGDSNRARKALKPIAIIIFVTEILLVITNIIASNFNTIVSDILVMLLISGYFISSLAIKKKKHSIKQ